MACELHFPQRSRCLCNKTLEAAAGKNPVSHVGKIYNLLAHEIAETSGLRLTQ